MHQKEKKGVRDKIFQQIILSPSRSGDILEHRILSRITTILLSQCGDDTNKEIYLDGESIESKLSGITDTMYLDEVSVKSASLEVGTNDEFLNQYKIIDKIGILIKYLEDTVMLGASLSLFKTQVNVAKIRYRVYIECTRLYFPELCIRRDFISPSCVLEGTDTFIAQNLVTRVTERLHSQSSYIRKDGIFIAENLSEEIHFEELDDERETDIEVKKTLNLNLFKTKILNYNVEYLSSYSQVIVKLC